MEKKTIFRLGVFFFFKFKEEPELRAAESFTIKQCKRVADAWSTVCGLGFDSPPSIRSPSLSFSLSVSSGRQAGLLPFLFPWGPRFARGPGLDSHSPYNGGGPRVPEAERGSGSNRGWRSGWLILESGPFIREFLRPIQVSRSPVYPRGIIIVPTGQGGAPKLQDSPWTGISKTDQVLRCYAVEMLRTFFKGDADADYSPQIRLVGDI